MSDESEIDNRPPIQNENKPENVANKATEKTADGPNCGQLLVSETAPDIKPATPLTKQAAEKEHKPSRTPENAICLRRLAIIRQTAKKWKDTAEFFAAIIVIGLLVTSIYQAWETQKQVAIANSQMVLDERAWVFVDMPDNNISTQSGNVIFTQIMKNVGKTPAVVTGDYYQVANNTNAIKRFDDEVFGEEVMLVPNESAPLQITVPPLAFEAM